MATFNIPVTVDDTMINEFKELIDNKMNHEYGFTRVTQDPETGDPVENYTYVQWLGVLIVENLKANLRGYLKGKKEKENQTEIENKTALITTA